MFEVEKPTLGMACKDNCGEFIKVACSIEDGVQGTKLQQMNSVLFDHGRRDVAGCQ